MVDQPQRGLVILVRDLLFLSRISATAQSLGVAVKLVRDPLAAATEPGERMIVDLNLAGALDAAVAWKSRQGGSVVGFVSHVDAETIVRARDAGIDRVVPRSQFVQILPEVLKG